MESAFATKHPVHVSFGSMEYRADEGRFYISIRLFADDFTKILEFINNEKLNLQTKSKKNSKLIDAYIKKNFRFKFKGSYKPKLMHFEYYTYNAKNEVNTVQVFYSYKLRKAPTEIHIMNTIMTDLFADQKNLLIFSCKNTEKPLTFDLNNSDTSFKID